MQVAAAHLPSKVQHCRIKVMLESSLLFRILNPLDPAYSPKETIEYLLKIIQEEVPVAAVAWFEHTVAVNTRVKGLVIDPFEMRYMLHTVRID